MKGQSKLVGQGLPQGSQVAFGRPQVLQNPLATIEEHFQVQDRHRQVVPGDEMLGSGQDGVALTLGFVHPSFVGGAGLAQQAAPDEVRQQAEVRRRDRAQDDSQLQATPALHHHSLAALHQQRGGRDKAAAVAPFAVTDQVFAKSCWRHWW